MEVVISAIGFVFLVLWAFHVERNTARTAEALKRIEVLLEKKEK
jgi:hypothetical protein